MSKPLELVWYGSHKPGPNRERILDVLGKRLTDAELAAEYHLQDVFCRREQWIEEVRGDDYTDSERQGQDYMYARLNTLYRFATHPHYDEEQP